MTNSFVAQSVNLYNSVTGIWQPTYKRDLTRNEANIRPELDMESSVRISKPIEVATV